MPTVINLVVGTIVSRPTIMVAWLPGIALLAYLLTNARAQNETTIYKRNDKKAGFVSESVAFGSGTAVACLMTGPLTGAPLPSINQAEAEFDG